MKSGAKWLGMAAVTLSSPLLAGASSDSAYLAFRQALGEPALIGAAADHPLADTPFRPIPAFELVDIDRDRLRLGFDLYHERRLSRDGTLGCNSCHSGMAGGGDGLAVAEGIGGALGVLNSPTTFNAAYNFRQFGDGRALNLAEQALGPIENPIEMGHDLSDVEAMLKEDASYARQFEALYPDGVTRRNLGDAIAYFETRMFNRPDSPFLRTLNGQEGQLSEQAIRGQERFQSVGCSSCHNGINLGGNSYQKLGAVVPYYDELRRPTAADDGVFARTGRESDRHVFKVPSLHNVAETAPYLHDGSVETLEETVRRMGTHQLGSQLGEEEVEDIVAFLHALGNGRMMGGMGRAMMQGQGRGRMGPGMSRGGMRREQ
ncbi:MAG: cytochrome-c peroxidase, partial [Pseudomonadota bacterium]